VTYRVTTLDLLSEYFVKNLVSDVLSTNPVSFVRPGTSVPTRSVLHSVGIMDEAKCLGAWA
jgi:hypothetical protein